MGQPIPISLAGGDYVSESKALSNVRRLNVYLSIPQAATLSEATLKGTPGLEQIITSGALNQINRGQHVKDGKPYYLNGTTLYRLDRAIDDGGVETFSLAALGTIPGSARASFADNGTQLIILDTVGGGWIVNEAAGTVFQQITDEDFTTTNGAPKYVEYVDTFFQVTTSEKKFKQSASNNGLAWSALDFTSAAADPDAIVAPVVVNNKLIIMGTETLEGFDNTGVSGFQRNGLLAQKGCFAPASLVKTGNSFMWIGGGADESPAVWTLNGSTPQKVSTTAIEEKLQAFTKEEISLAFAFYYAQAGAYFVEFSLPTITFVYELITQVWHERQSQVINSKGLTENVRHRVNSVSTAYGRVLCGDSEDGRIGELKLDTYTEYGNSILRAFSLQPFAAQGTSMSVTSVEITMESGVGNTAQPNPEIRLSTSRDGVSFNDPVPRALGKIGQYSIRQMWPRLGRFARFGVLLFEYSDPCEFRAIKLRMNVKQGAQRGR